MKNLVLFIFVFICTLPSISQKIKVDNDLSNLDSVTVFLDGAEINRTKELILKEGLNKVEFKGLSPFIDENSIRVQTDEKYNILSISHHEDYLFNEEFRPELKLVTDSISMIESGLVEIENRLKAFKSEEDMLAKNHLLLNNTSIENLNKAASFFRQRYTEINNHVSKLDHEKTMLTKRLNRLNLQKGNIDSKGHYNRGKIVIIIDSNVAEVAEVGVKYIVGNAGWAALYDIKASNTKKPIDLVYKAKVYNETEVSWVNIPLKLSTSDPTRNITKPSLETWEINYNKNSLFPSSKSLPLNQQYKQKTNLKQEEESVHMMIPVDDLNAEFIITGKHNIASSSNPYFVSVGNFSLQATYKHYCAPKIENSAFLIAKVTGWEQINLIAGKANTYFNGAYIGNSMINPAEVSDTMDVSLGRDNRITIERVKKKEQSSKQLIGGSRKETYAFETIIKNSRNDRVEIQILDQIPVSLDSEIVVEKIKSEGALFNELDGSLSWILEIDPISIKQTSFTFSIKYPRNRSIFARNCGMRSIRYF